ncbi:hypothetical protein [Pectobacterium parmentieri]|nr:hypothetical protein [Pectobacterium parmentieri]
MQTNSHRYGAIFPDTPHNSASVLINERALAHYRTVFSARSVSGMVYAFL